MAIANCVKCHKVFQKHLTDRCPACVDKEKDQFTAIYRILQEFHGTDGILIEELSRRVNMDADEIETWYLEGKFGTYGVYLKSQCKQCKTVVSSRERKGRYCLECSHKLSTEANVAVRPRHVVLKEYEAVKAGLPIPKESQPTRKAAVPVRPKVQPEVAPMAPAAQQEELVPVTGQGNQGGMRVSDMGAAPQPETKAGDLTPEQVKALREQMGFIRPT